MLDALSKALGYLSAGLWPLFPYGAVPGCASDSKTVFNPAWVTQTKVRFSNSNCGARFTMMALLGAGIGPGRSEGQPVLRARPSRRRKPDGQDVYATLPLTTLITVKRPSLPCEALALMLIGGR
jgi:hypothetical protein